VEPYVRIRLEWRRKAQEIQERLDETPDDAALRLELGRLLYARSMAAEAPETLRGAPGKPALRGEVARHLMQLSGRGFNPVS
jgi:hypothetical protein